MTQVEKSLYERLGGYDVIAGFTTEYVKRIRADPRFARFSGGRSTDKKMRDLQMNIDYLCKATGGTTYYMGRDMKTSHAGLKITEEEWEANMTYWAEAMDVFKVPPMEKEEVLRLIGHTKSDIVER
jgi:hemoglobin